MRRVIWSVLTGLGVFFIVLALMLRFFVPGQSVKFPLNEYSKITLEGTGLSYFSAAQVQEFSGVTMAATNTTAGNVAAADAAGSSRIAVWRSFTAIEDLTHHAPFQYSTEQLAFDRKTGVLINCCGTFVGSDHPHVSGQGYVWPFGTQKRTYQVFDTTLLKPVPYAYAGTATVDGITTYVFVAHIPSQQIGTQTLPASLVGLPGAEVTLPEFYSATKTDWVDPVTGTPIKFDLKQRYTLQDSSGATRLVLFDGDLTSTPASVAASAASDNSNANQIRFVEIWGPLGAGILGLILLVAGLVLAARRPEGQYEEYEAGEPVGSAS